jgi:choline dehydrogenase-like flavoprotein
MPSPDFDVIIVGSGPAGVSAVYPLVNAGLKVLLVDGGHLPSTLAEIPMPTDSGYIHNRIHDAEQWRWMIGPGYEAIKNLQNPSPKFRVPFHAYVFEDFNRLNNVAGENFFAVGSLARGGLSNAWGCGVAKYSREELSLFPFDQEDIEFSYNEVGKRIGISGCASDDMSDYFRLDEVSQPPIEMDVKHGYIYSKYYLKKSKGLIKPGFRLGHARVAALSKAFSGRKGCNLSGNCLWGCSRGALYTAASELRSLAKYKNFYEKPGFLVNSIGQSDGFNFINGINLSSGENEKITSRQIFMAAGTLASTKLVLNAINYSESKPLLSCPVAAYLMWLPKFLGAPKVNGFGLGQLSFAIELDSGHTGFGSTFSTIGIPVSEFAYHLPIGRRYAIDLMSNLLSSCIVGNIFLPGALSKARLKIVNGGLTIDGGDVAQSSVILSNAKNRLRREFLQLGVIMLPGSFTQSKTGSDIHYAGTLPMRHRPILGESSQFGEIVGLPGVYAVDGSSLPVLSERSHTLTIMANADRIARHVALKYKSR